MFSLFSKLLQMATWLLVVYTVYTLVITYIIGISERDSLFETVNESLLYIGSTIRVEIESGLGIDGLHISYFLVTTKRISIRLISYSNILSAYFMLSHFTNWYLYTIRVQLHVTQGLPTLATVRPHSDIELSLFHQTTCVRL